MQLLISGSLPGPELQGCVWKWCSWEILRATYLGVLLHPWPPFPWLIQASCNYYSHCVHNISLCLLTYPHVLPKGASKQRLVLCTEWPIWDMQRRQLLHHLNAPPPNFWVALIMWHEPAGNSHPRHMRLCTLVWDGHFCVARMLYSGLTATFTSLPVHLREQVNL